MLSHTNATYSEAFRLSLSPNPTSDQLMVSFQDVASFQPWSYRIFDQLGRTVKQVDVVYQSRHAIEVANLPSAMYWMVISMDGQLLKRTFVKR